MSTNDGFSFVVFCLIISPPRPSASVAAPCTIQPIRYFLPSSSLSHAVANAAAVSVTFSSSSVYPLCWVVANDVFAFFVAGNGGGRAAFCPLPPWDHVCAPQCEKRRPPCPLFLLQQQCYWASGSVFTTQARRTALYDPSETSSPKLKSQDAA